MASCIAILDIANEVIRFAAEDDGAEWHTSPRQREHASSADGQLAEKERLGRRPFVAANVTAGIGRLTQLAVDPGGSAMPAADLHGRRITRAMSIRADSTPRLRRDRRRRLDIQKSGEDAPTPLRR